MSDSHTRRLVRDLLRALRRALPAVREADRAYKALVRAADHTADRPKAGRPSDGQS
jgi:hypothetical protein